MYTNALVSQKIDWSLWDVTDQTISSMDTSINSKKIPQLFSIVDKYIGWKPYTTNFDIGGGRFDNVTDYMSERLIDHLIYDPFNRSKVHNIKTITEAYYKGVDTVTISNVLNVVKEESVRHNILLQAHNILKSNGTLYIRVYEGDRSGQCKETVKGWQNNQPTKFYLREVKKLFPNTYIKYGIFIASK